MGRFREHVHLDFAGRFEIKEGIAAAKLGSDTLRLMQDEVFYVPRGVPHVNPYNADTTRLRVRQSFDPPTEGARSYVQTLARVLWDGRDDNGELPVAVILAVSDVTRERTYATGLPCLTSWGEAASFAMQRRLLLPFGRLLAGARDYGVYLTYEPEPKVAAVEPEGAQPGGRGAGGRGRGTGRPRRPSSAAEAPKVPADDSVDEADRAGS